MALKQWSGPPATRRLLQAIRIEYIDQLGDKEDVVDQGEHQRRLVR